MIIPTPARAGVGMIIRDKKDGFRRPIHNIENTPFRTKFERDMAELHSCTGLGCISDSNPRTLPVRSRLGLYAIVTVGVIDNAEALVQALEGDEGQQHPEEYADSGTQRGQWLLHAICRQFGFDSLAYQSVDGLLEAIGMDRDRVCTYCWTGKE